MEELFGVKLPDNDAKREFALKKHIALWDTYGSLVRAENNSSDTNLTDLVPNDIDALLMQYPQIRHIFCTGQKSYNGLLKHFDNPEVEVALLPSTSPAYASMSFNEKLHRYSVVKDILERDD
jgi:hypoxanthine-DNA glycosylase